MTLPFTKRQLNEIIRVTSEGGEFVLLADKTYMKLFKSGQFTGAATRHMYLLDLFVRMQRYLSFDMKVEKIKELRSGNK